MAAPYKTIDKIVDIVKAHVPKDRIPDLLMDLKKTLMDSKNQSYNETIKRIVKRFQDD